MEKATPLPSFVEVCGGLDDWTLIGFDEGSAHKSAHGIRNYLHSLGDSPLGHGPPYETVPPF